MMRFFGFLFIIIGIVLFVGGLNIFTFDFYIAFSYLWPLILINIGLGMLTKNRRLLNIVKGLSLICFLLFAIFGYDYTAEKAESEFPLQIVSDVSKKVKPASEIINYSSSELKSKSKLVIEEIDSSYAISAGDNPGITSSTNLDIELKEGTKYNKYIIEGIKSAGSEPLALSLSKDTIWEIEVESFKTDLSLDASGFKFDELELSGLSNTLELTLAGDSSGKVEIDGTDAKLKLLVASDSQYKLETDCLSTKIKVENKLIEQSNYESDNYSKDRGVLITIDGINAEIEIVKVDK